MFHTGVLTASILASLYVLILGRADAIENPIKSYICWLGFCLVDFFLITLGLTVCLALIDEAFYNNLGLLWLLCKISLLLAGVLFMIRVALRVVVVPLWTKCELLDGQPRRPVKS